MDTKFEHLMQIKVEVPDLRDLLLLSSLYVCNTTTDILDLVSS